MRQKVLLAEIQQLSLCKDEVRRRGETIVGGAVADQQGPRRRRTGLSGDTAFAGSASGLAVRSEVRETESIPAIADGFELVCDDQQVIEAVTTENIVDHIVETVAHDPKAQSVRAAELGESCEFGVDVDRREIGVDVVLPGLQKVDLPRHALAAADLTATPCRFDRHPSRAGKPLEQAVGHILI